MNRPTPVLPYTTRALNSRHGRRLEEVMVPPEHREAALRILYPFEPIPALSDQVQDLHTGKSFAVGEFRVFREDGTDILTTPWYPEGGGSVIDWMPDTAAADGEPIQVEEVRHGHEQTLIRLLELHAYE